MIDFHLFLSQKKETKTKTMRKKEREKVKDE